VFIVNLMIGNDSSVYWPSITMLFDCTFVARLLHCYDTLTVRYNSRNS